MVSQLTVLLLRQAVEVSSKFSNSVRWHDQARYALPYLVENTSGSDEFIILNRFYKPIGLHNTNVHVNFNAKCFAGWRIDRTDFHDAALDNVGDVALYLFSDANAPWYGKRELHTYREKLISTFQPVLAAAAV